ncbi:sigma 54-interacting transcriptional regulator [Sporomusa acidovorans]|uniref:HTH-type transcriptional regulatory protein TyrR n=1 Tax=Sporomusa acidovorans (strain ATCC 49682 / DSM 3132 / Mol) TaxID=1123286 RepID=A0ABZ3IZ64_SPOA4|nr:sigma 54-interacting transcriptional regulator [Sporomusa acidovorans]OZC19168.1 transcriptional regulatory protein TyrR [Sporomusa acidovorans DSM 3132]SDF11796.1 transcriptional regulator of aroF, aroG, tyrA and aromatic amino acid transport [Sporomusa acidovorans]
MDNLRLKISNIDRVGLVLDISQLLAIRQINIISMEVELNTVYMEIQALDSASKQDLVNKLRAIPHVTTVAEINLMPHQERSEQINAVLTSVSDGIISIDLERRITQYNAAAEKIIRLPARDVIGKNFADIFPADSPLLVTLQQGVSYNNREIVLEKTKSHYLSSGRPIFDKVGRIIGAVTVIKDISAVRELVYTVTAQRQITFKEILFTSQAMQRIISMAKSIAKGDSTVLIRGETGTGKELIARALHAASVRHDKIFVPLNCAAIPDALLESELFGYEDGAFTGATKGGKHGLFEFANNGTIFLDEIGEMPPHLQAKLLRVLQEGKVRRIGGNREIPVNIRVLAATNRDLEKMIATGGFREDLYYRLNVIPLFIPPLRERRDDIPLLAQFFLKRCASRLHKEVDTFQQSALEKLINYHWPGNIRELENVIERAVNIVPDTMILREHIIFDQDYTPSVSAVFACDQTLDEIIYEVEHNVLLKALGKYTTSRQLGVALGLSHTAVLKKLRKHQLSLSHERGRHTN